MASASLSLPALKASYSKAASQRTPFLQQPISPFSQINAKPTKFKLFSSSSSISSTIISTEQIDPLEPDLQIHDPNEKFDWFSQWYPLAPVCDLDKRVPHGKRVMGLDVVVWWDRNEKAWKVFDDCCPHRLAPLSEGRIDQWGRLQCVYHGWCFNGSGDCKFIPQAPPEGPPVHTSKKACVASYPCTVQNGIVWFWSNSDPQYKNILEKKQPPYIPELDDPSYSKMMTTRDIPYGYEVLTENLMDPAHVPYAHYGILRLPKSKNRSQADREGGMPLEISIQAMDINGFLARQDWGSNKFVPPCVFYSSPSIIADQGNGSLPSPSSEKDSPSRSKRRVLFVFMCIPVSPGKSRLIWTFPRNFALWVDKIVPRWMSHVRGNLVLDSDLYLLHVEEHKIMEVGPSNWQRACFLPTKSDAKVVAFRRWLKRYSGGQVDWGEKFDGSLPPPPPREQLLDRYWSHVVNCTSCSAAYKGLNVLEVVLQVISIGLVAIVAATKQTAMHAVARMTIVSAAVICFAASRCSSSPEIV
ncbi:hypothetical protein Ancab_036724 [Ancistrocladus abbreviatus]